MSTTQTHLKDLTRQSNRQSVREMGASTVQEFFEANRRSIEAILPRHMTADRMLKIVMHSLRTTPELRECNTASLWGAAIQCSQLGLEPNTVLGHAYLLPFYNSRAQRKEVQFIPGYKGLIELALRSPKTQAIYAYEVYEADLNDGKFRIHLGTDPRIEHIPALKGRLDENSVIGFYAVAQFREGGHIFEWMETEKVNAIRDRSQGYRNAIKYNKSHPWITDWIQMGRKTPIRRLANYVPLSPEFQMAAALDSMAEAGESQGLDEVLDGTYSILTPEAAQGNEGPGADTSDDTETPDDGAPQESDQSVSEADKVVLRIQAAKSQDALDEVMDQARDLGLEGPEKAKVTRAYNQAVGRMNEGPGDDGPPDNNGAHGAFSGE